MSTGQVVDQKGEEMTTSAISFQQYLDTLPEQERLACVMTAGEEILKLVPVAHLRAMCSRFESNPQPGKKLPSGNAFDRHTRKARLWLDFIDDLEALAKE